MNKGGKYLDSKIGRETMLSNARNVSAVLNERQQKVLLPRPNTQAIERFRRKGARSMAKG